MQLPAAAPTNENFSALCRAARLLVISAAGGYALLGANYELAGVEYAIGGEPDWQAQYATLARMGALTVNALVAADIDSDAV